MNGQKIKEIFNWMLRKYKINVEVWQKRSDTPKKIKEDLARFIEERKGKRYYYLLKTGKQLTPQGNIYEYLTGDNKLKLYQKDSDTFIPFKWSFEDMESGQVDALGMDEDVKFLISQEFREADMRHRTKQGIWDKYGNALSALMILVGAGIFFAILNRDLTNNIAQLSKIYEGLKPILEGVKSGGF